MEEHDIDPEAGLVVTLGTTGFNVDKDNLFSVSIADTEGPASTHYIKYPIGDVDVSGVTEHTGVYQYMYESGARFYAEVLDELMPRIKEAPYVITHTYEFFEPWSEVLAHELALKPVVDVVSWIKLMDRNGLVPLSVKELFELNRVVQRQVSFMKQRCYSLDNLCYRFGSSDLMKAESKIPTLELKPRQVQFLYETVKWM